MVLITVLYELEQYLNPSDTSEDFDLASAFLTAYIAP